MKGELYTKVETKRGKIKEIEGGLTKIALDGQYYSQNYIEVNGKDYNTAELGGKLENIEHQIRIEKDGKDVFHGTFEELCARLQSTLEGDK